MKLNWGKLGGQLGVGFIVVGAFFLFLGWNGAASSDRVPSQFPYLISGGLVGVSLVLVGAAMMVIQNQRADRAQIQATLLEMRAVLERMAPSSSAFDPSVVPAGMVVAGPTTYHRPGCSLIEGREGLRAMQREEADTSGLSPCRVCDPAESLFETAPIKKTTTRRRPRKTATR